MAVQLYSFRPVRMMLKCVIISARNGSVYAGTPYRNLSFPEFHTGTYQYTLHPFTFFFQFFLEYIFLFVSRVAQSV
jgi:hypothetical protein